MIVDPFLGGVVVGRIGRNGRGNDLTPRSVEIGRWRIAEAMLVKEPPATARLCRGILHTRVHDDRSRSHQWALHWLGGLRHIVVPKYRIQRLYHDVLLLLLRVLHLNSEERGRDLWIHEDGQVIFAFTRGARRRCPPCWFHDLGDWLWSYAGCDCVEFCEVLSFGSAHFHARL